MDCSEMETGVRIGNSISKKKELMLYNAKSIKKKCRYQQNCKLFETNQNVWRPHCSNVMANGKILTQTQSSTNLSRAEIHNFWDLFHT